MINPAVRVPTWEVKERAIAPARYRFFVGMSALSLAVVLAGFAPSFYLRAFVGPPEVGPPGVFALRGPDLPAHSVIHGIVLTAWFVLAFAQPSLVATHRTQLHRRVGVAGVLLGAGVVTSSLVTAMHRTTAIIDEVPAPPIGENLVILIAFSICITAGVLRRHRPAEHKRLMLFASLSILPPALSRLGITVAQVTTWFPAERGQAVGGAILLILILVVLGHDLITERRLHRGTLLGLAAILVGVVSRELLVRSGGWVAFVRFFM